MIVNPFKPDFYERVGVGGGGRVEGGWEVGGEGGGGRQRYGAMGRFECGRTFLEMRRRTRVNALNSLIRSKTVPGSILFVAFVEHNSSLHRKRAPNLLGEGRKKFLHFSKINGFLFFSLRFRLSFQGKD